MNRLIQFFCFLFCSLTTTSFSAQGADIHIPRLDEPMSFEIAHSGGNCGGCEWTMAHGTITKDTPDVFLRFIQRNNFKKSGIPNVVFYSPGGNLLPALKLGRLLREYNVFTEVSKTASEPSSSIGWKVQTKEPGICVSACAYAFFGGTIRKIEEGSKFGVHQFSLAKSLASDNSELDSGGTQALVGLLAYYIHSMGVDPSILFLAGSTNPGEVSYLSLDLLKELKVTTDELDKFVFQGRILEPLRQGVVAVAKRGNSYGSQEALSIFCRRNNRQPVLMMSKRLSDSFLPLPLMKTQNLKK
jgi:hypothetical protein